jgi:hypothetical protein
MIVPTHRRQNGLDAELDALVAREVDALALRKARTPNGKPARDQAASGRADNEPATLHEDVRADQAAARASRPHDDAGQGPARNFSTTNVIGIRHGNPSGGLNDIPFSADEEAFIEEAVAFLRRRANADVILDEIWSHAVPRHDDDVAEVRGEDVNAAQSLQDETAGPGGGAVGDDGSSSPEHGHVAPMRPAGALRSSESASEQSADGDESTSLAARAAPRSGKGTAVNDRSDEESTP